MVLHTAALAALLAAPVQGTAPELPAGLARHVERGIAAVLALEDGASPGEWPYEGALRTDGAIPFGYRVGGTGCVVEALAVLPGLEHDAARGAALDRGLAFLARALAEEEMSASTHPGIDLRIWGLIAGARGLLAARAAGAAGAPPPAELDRLVRELLARLAQLEIPRKHIVEGRCHEPGRAVAQCLRRDPKLMRSGPAGRSRRPRRPGPPGRHRERGAWC